MAIGDYSKTTYVNGVAPAINATNLNNNEDKTKELDIAVSSIETWQENEKPVSTSSRILDLTGDRAPAIPDDPAGVTHFQDAWATTDGWSVVNGAGSVSGGWFKATPSSATTVQLVKSISTSAKLFAARVKRATAGNVILRVYDGDTTNTIKTIYFEAGVVQSINAYLSGTVVNVQLQYTSSGVGDTLEIDWVYIGTGAYLSKLVDRANVPWTNYGALPVDGPFGKGLQFNGAQYLQAPGPMIGTTGTIAIMFKRGTVGPQQYIFANCEDTAHKGLSILFMSDNQLAVRYGSDTTYFTKNIKIITDTTDIHTLVLTFTATGGTATVDGVDYDYTASLTMTGPARKAVLGALTNASQFFTGTIYALRADSRVWTDEEIARWSRDPYSEESIPMSSTPTANALVQWPASGNFPDSNGINASTLGGYAQSQFPKIASNGACIDISYGNIHDDYVTGFYMGANVTNAPGTAWWFFQVYRYNELFKRVVAYDFHNNQRTLTKHCNNGTWGGWLKIWNEGNVGTNWSSALAANLGSGWTTALAASAGAGILAQLLTVDGAGSGLETDKIPNGTKTGTSTGTVGQVSQDASYLYVCTATNTWKRVALTSF